MQAFNFSAFLTAALLLSACQGTAQTTAETAGLESGDYCYRNITSNGDITDVEELLFTVNGRSVTGQYNWLPEFKDQRKGTFEGTANGNAINASYEFSQEGRTQTEDITIDVNETEAVIEGGAPELGLGRTISKVDC